MSFFLAVISNKVDISAVSSLSHFPNSCPKYPTLTGQHSGLMDGSSLIQTGEVGWKRRAGVQDRRRNLVWRRHCHTQRMFEPTVTLVTSLAQLQGVSSQCPSNQHLLPLVCQELPFTDGTMFSWMAGSRRFESRKGRAELHWWVIWGAWASGFRGLVR